MSVLDLSVFLWGLPLFGVSVTGSISSSLRVEMLSELSIFQAGLAIVVTAVKVTCGSGQRIMGLLKDHWDDPSCVAVNPNLLHKFSHFDSKSKIMLAMITMLYLEL